jgi:hypothetical protein
VKLTSFCAAALACVATAGLAPAAGATRRHAADPVNLIRDASAEGATPDASGDKVPVKAWTVSHHSQLTAVAYGAVSFPGKTSPGPHNRGKNFFAGGPSGDSAKGTQIDSLRGYWHMIAAGNAQFTLAGWLGGYATQHDYATLSVTWLNAHGRPVGDVTKIGPVGPIARHNRSGTLKRRVTAAVPKRAHSALITLRMVRKEGVYIDGYADKLSLTIAHK